MASRLIPAGKLHAHPALAEEDTPALDTSYINRRQPDQEGLDFEGLFRDGLKIVQQVSGERWTDYNEHDPGVTMLEALCYVLTDLVYRTGYHPADYLASSDGSIDFKRQSLYRPDEIFPSHPVTENDYRKLILSCIPFIDNVWICPDEGGKFSCRGLYRIYVLLSESVKDQDDPVVRKAFCDVVGKLYIANRNLCEDLAGVEIVRRIPYSLRGDIEIDGKQEPADILARVYFECSQYLSPRVPIHSYFEKHQEGKSLDELFTGILNVKGYVEDSELYPWRGHYSIPDLIANISRIPGVKNINRLVFVDAHGKETDTINLEHCLAHRAVACLVSSPPIKGLSLFKAGKTFPVSQADVEQEFSRLDYTYQVSRQRSHSFDWLQAMLPGGTNRNISEYFSLQNHFPDIYGLNAYGVPDSASPERKAQAAQLKAYLLFFEQVIANFMQNLQEIPRLFSVDESLRQSYFHKVLSNDEVPGVEPLYLDGFTGMDERLSGLISDFDNHCDRRSRILDYLLAVYGEKFSQHSLRHFFPDTTEEKRIGNKIAFIKDVVNLGKRRSAAFDYREPVMNDDNLSGLKAKLRLLLGLREWREEVRQEGGGDGWQDGDFYLVEHILLRPGERRRHQQVSVPEDFYSFRLSLIFPSEIAGSSNSAFRNLTEETVARNCPVHLYPEVFWLDPDNMRRFGRLLEVWLKTKSSLSISPETVDEAAGELLRFLLEIRTTHE